MNHRTRPDRAQTPVFPERLENYIGAEPPVCFTDALVGLLDLPALGFARACGERLVRAISGWV